MSGSAPVATLLRLGKRQTPTRRLFCLPYAGGGVAAYGQWWRSLPADIEVMGVQFPGRESRIAEAPLDSVAAMAAAALPAILAASDLPFALFGHSMGGLVAFELTLALEQREESERPQHLFVSARRAPDVREPEPSMSPMSDEQFLDELSGRYGAISDDVRREPELLSLLLPVMRADVRAIEVYEPPTGRMVQCPLEVYGGTTDLHPRPEELAAWQRWAAQRIEVTLFEGDHFFLAPQREALTAHMAKAWPSATGHQRW